METTPALNATSELIVKILQTDDYYEILGVTRSATEADIKKSYRNIARLIHPDKCNLEKCDEAFKKVGTAYKCLSNHESRQTYDLTGTDADDAPHPGSFDRDMFAQMFGNENHTRQNGVHTNIVLPPWLIVIINLVPWKLVGPVLFVVFIFCFFQFLMWILSLSLYILPALYLTPARIRWWLVLLILILSLIGYI